MLRQANLVISTFLSSESLHTTEIVQDLRETLRIQLDTIQEKLNRLIEQARVERERAHTLRQQSRQVRQQKRR